VAWAFGWGQGDRFAPVSKFGGGNGVHQSFVCRATFEW
jgi:hypothetical protein